MPLYEHVVLVRQDVSAQQVETMTDQFKTTVEGLGGSVSKVEYWGLKSLAYRIKKNRKSHYALLNIDAPPAAIAELERLHLISEDVIRFMTVRVEALEDGPSMMLQKRERDERRGERGERGDRGDRPRRDRDDRGPRRGRDDDDMDGEENL